MPSIISLQGAYIRIPKWHKSVGSASWWCRFDFVLRVSPWFVPKTFRSRNWFTTLVYHHGEGYGESLSTLPRTVLSTIPPLYILPGYEPRLGGKIKARLTSEGSSEDLTPRYFSARTTSKVSSGTPPCGNTSFGSNCQVEGSRLSGANSDLDDPIVGEVVNSVNYGKEGNVNVLVDCPMNMPAMPAVPTSMIPDIGIRDRWSSTCPRLPAFRDKVSTLLEYVAKSYSMPISTRGVNLMGESYQKQSPTKGPCTLLT